MVYRLVTSSSSSFDRFVSRALFSTFTLGMLARGTAFMQMVVPAGAVAAGAGRGVGCSNFVYIL